MKYESIIKLLSLQYTTHTVDCTQSLVKQLSSIQKETYENNERIVVSMPDITKLNDLQNIVNSLDISNFFVMIITEDQNVVNEIERVTSELSYDPIPFTAVLVTGDEYKIIKQKKQETKHNTRQGRIESLNLPNENFCVLPWVALEIQPNGSHAVCCLAEQPVKDEKGNTLTVRNSTIDQILKADSLTKLRRDFLANKKPSTCAKCWRVEDSGGTSKRIHSLDRLKHLGIANQTWTEDRKELMMFDLKVGNICNLKCRICGSYSSSQIATEELPKKDKKKSFSYKMIEQGRWPREQDHFWENIVSYSKEIRYLEFTGGEPFLIKEHFTFLQQLVDLGIAGQIEIHYNTNGTQYPEKAIEIWRHFKLIEIAFSIDDVDERFEYQRKNAIWSEVNENIQKYKQLKNKLGNIHLQVCSTVNVFNVLYLEHLSKWIDQQQFDNVYWNMLHDEPSVSIRSLPESTKKIVQEHLESVDVTPFHRKHFDDFIKFMNNGESWNNKALLVKIKSKDLVRKENLWDHHSELAEAIGYER